MINEILNEIDVLEKEAEKILADANERASNILSSVPDENTKKREEFFSQIKEEVVGILSKAESFARDETAQINRTTQQKSEMITKNSEKNSAKAIGLIVEAITKGL